MCTIYCEGRGIESELLTIKEAAHAAGISCRTMHYWIKGGRLHLMEDAGDLTLICKRSLVARYTKVVMPRLENVEGVLQRVG